MKSKSRLGTVSFDGVDYDLDDLELDDLAEIEEICGKDLNELSFGSARTLRACAYVIKRKASPEFTLADAGKLKAIAFLPKEEDEEAGEGRPPADAADDEASGSAELSGHQ